MTLDEALQDLQTLRTVAAGLSRERDAIHVLLAAYYQTGCRWHETGVSRGLREAILQKEGRRVDGRIKRKVFRFLIELTCRADAKLKSRYSNALEFARLRGCSPEELVGFVKRNGIEQCAKRYVAYRKRLA
jgi:hypothetical protein